MTKNEAIFAPLEGIPPDGRIKHMIELVEGAKPVMKRPYRLSEVLEATRQRADSAKHVSRGLDPTLSISVGHSYTDGTQEGWLMEDVCRLQGA